MKFQNKTVLITGSSRGIGRATALLFAEEGSKVIVNYLSSEQQAKEVVKEIQSMGQKAIMIKCDVSKPEQVKEMVQKSVKTFDKIDILVNNAGIVFDVPFSKRTLDHWKRTLWVNLIGTFLCSKYASQKMKKGSIVNISSTNAINAFSPESIDYDCSKAGIISMTRNLAKELAPDIRVNAVAPGWVDTDMNKELPEEFIQDEVEKIYLKRFAKAKEIARSILFLASDDSSYITGSILKIDGGYG